MRRTVSSSLGALLAIVLLVSTALAQGSAEGSPEPEPMPWADYVAALEAFTANDPFAALGPEPSIGDVTAAIEQLIALASVEGERLEAVVPEACYAEAHRQVLAYWQDSTSQYQAALPELSSVADLADVVPIVGAIDEALRAGHPAAYAEAPDGAGFDGSVFNVLDAVATCGPEPSATPAATPRSTGATPLGRAVTFTPPGTDSILFTDWAAMKAAHGYGGVTSARPLRRRMEAMLDLSTLEAPMAAFGLDRMAGHADAWGWDTTDLDWEASFVADGPPVAVLRFREGFDLGPVEERFDERDFSTEVYGDATIRSHDLDPGADWITQSDLGILNTAILDDGRTLVLSSSLDGVKAALDARSIQSFRAPPSWLVADGLGEPLSAAIEIGTDACIAYDPRIASGAEEPAGASLPADVGRLQAWEAMGMGTYRDGDLATGRFVFAYGSAEDAAADLGGRAGLAETASSMRTGEPLSDSVMQLASATADGPLVMLEVRPVGGEPRRLADAWLTRDLAFAGCG